MFGQVFYHDTIRKYVILFGTLFNDVYINKGDGTDTTQTIKVPISYGPKQKFLVRLEQDPTITKPVAIQLPRMSFEMVDISYAAERKLPTINKVSVVNSDDPSKLMYQYMPVPYDIRFNLNIMVKQARDGTRILEQILPFFTPEWTATLNLDSTMQHRYDIPIILNNVTSEDSYTGNFTERRAITWTLSFTMKGYVFGATRSQKVIKNTNINFYNINAAEDIDAAIGTTQVYDTLNTIPVLVGKTLDQIDADDDYAITQTIEQFYDQ